MSTGNSKFYLLLGWWPYCLRLIRMTIAKLGIGRSARIIGDSGEGSGLLSTHDAKGRNGQL